MLHFLANVAFQYKFVALVQSVGGQGFCKQMLHLGEKVCVNTNLWLFDTDLWHLNTFL